MTSQRATVIRTATLLLIAAKMCWIVVLLTVGDYDYRRVHDEDIVRFLTGVVSLPLYLVLAILFLWLAKNWIRWTLIALSAASAIGLSGSGIVFGLPHFLARNYDRDAKMIPYILVSIALNLALCAVLIATPKSTVD